MVFTNLLQWMQHPEMLNRDTLYELRNVLAHYPYFQTARLLYLKNLYLLHDVSFGMELRKSVLYVADRRMLFYFIEGKHSIVHPVAEDEETELPGKEPSVDRTLTLIDAFLSTLPQGTLMQDELDYPLDYTTYLQADDADTYADRKEEWDALIGDFIAEKGIDKQKTAPLTNGEQVPQVTAESGNTDTEDENYFTETLAKIYIKQHRYAKALEIIKKLSLKYPKKNAYFADQIRFLEKLIINANSK